jgi:hypothetical protein
MRERIAQLLGRRSVPTQDVRLVERVVELQSQLEALVSISYRAGAEAHPFDEESANVYSSSGEDGILAHILSRIGTGPKRCIDLGAGSVDGSNVANLIVNRGFQGLLIDADAASLQRAEAFYRDSAADHQPTIVNSVVNAENVNDLLRKHGYSGEIDVLSIDLDGVDYWIWKAIDAVEPRVLIVEYQDILGPDRSWTVPYRPDFSAGDHEVNRDLNNYCGASLRAFARLSKQRDLRLVGCSRGGWNAFFVGRGLAEAELPEATIESCFRFAWNEYGMAQRFPLVADMPWEEV